MGLEPIGGRIGLVAEASICVISAAVSLLLWPWWLVHVLIHLI